MRALIVALCLLVSPTVLAGPKKSDLNVAYVNMNQALNGVKEGQRNKAQLKKDFEGKQRQLDKMQKDLKAKQEKFEKKKAMMKSAVRTKKERQLQGELMQLQQTYMQLQRQLMDREGKVTGDIAGKLREIIGQIGDREAYDMILDIGTTVLYHKRHKDITRRVIAEYDKKFP